MQSKDQQFDVVIIGGGASGMMAAISAAKLGKNVVILEKNASLGQKLDITGGGRCNITNAEFDTRKFLKVYGDAESFLHSPFSKFSAKDTFEFFESRGLPLVTQARNRVFPKTEKATDVCNLLKNEIKKLKITVIHKCSVKSILHDQGVITGVQTSQGIIKGGSYVLATGGMSHPETGSTGDGFVWLKNLGHTIKDPTPTIVPLAVDDAWIKSLPGVSLSFMKITFYAEGKKSFSKTGKVLFTHFGLSGPLILNSSSKVADLLHTGKVTAKIDAYPDTTLGTLEQQIIKVFDANKNKMLKTIFKEIVPAGTHDAIMSLLPEINFETKVHSITRDERKSIANLLKELPVSISGLMGYDRAVVADGGVTLSEIDTRTMRSKKISNLFVTGDLLHINRPSGGFSLQLCWTTGYVAGISA
jgi:predicted Rossmann fold flavoprotein